jgi:hypothetical protein
VKGGSVNSRGDCAPADAVAPGPPTPFFLQGPAAWKRLWRGLRWGLFDLDPTLGLYLGVGILLSALVMAFVPVGWISHYLGGTAPVLALLVVALFGRLSTSVWWAIFRWLPPCRRSSPAPGGRFCGGLCAGSCGVFLEPNGGRHYAKCTAYR